MLRVYNGLSTTSDSSQALGSLLKAGEGQGLKLSSIYLVIFSRHQKNLLFRLTCSVPELLNITLKVTLSLYKIPKTQVWVGQSAGVKQAYRENL